MRKTFLAIALATGVWGGVSASAQKRTQTDTTVAQLLDQFEKQKYSHEQFYVAKSIVATKDASVLPKLEPWLNCEDRQFRGNAAFIFTGFGDPRGFEVIVAILSDFSPRPATPNLGPYAGPKGFEALSRAQTRSDRNYAVWLLGQLKDSRGVPVLIPLLKDPGVSEGVAWSLGQIGDRSAIQPLIGTLSEPDPGLKFSAIRALTDLKATEALPALQRLLDDKGLFNNRESIAAEAQTAISKLQSKSWR
jgi:HEAT repeat protein